MLRESSDRICHSSIELRIVGGFHASLLRHLLILKGVAEMKVDTEMLYHRDIWILQNGVLCM
jgi:hypothetical protein